MAVYHPVPDFSEKIRKNVKRLPLILCEDISGSMITKRELMNEQLEKFFEIKSKEPGACKRTDIEIIQFNNKLYEVATSSLDMYNFSPITSDQMSGTTHLWAALEKALQTCEKYLDPAKYWTPWILLYTDGYPNDEPAELKDRVKNKLRQYELEKKIIIFILGIGSVHEKDNNVNLALLNDISRLGEQVVLLAQEQEIDIERFFQFVMRTMVKTLTSMQFFMRDKNGKLALDPTKLVEIFNQQKLQSRHK